MPRSLGRSRTLKKAFPEAMAKIAAGAARGKPIELWFGDEARIEQKSIITRRWAKRGTRPSAPKDQRTASACAYHFGAIFPAEGKGAAIVGPYCNTATMNLHQVALLLNFGHYSGVGPVAGKVRADSSACTPTARSCSVSGNLSKAGIKRHSMSFPSLSCLSSVSRNADA